MTTDYYETFDIRDKETHEYIRNLTRENLADYVLGKYAPYDKGGNFRKYEPLRDEIHHIIHCPGGIIYYDSIEISLASKDKFSKFADDLFNALNSGSITLYEAYEKLASSGYKETSSEYSEYGYHYYVMKDSHEGFFIRLNYSLHPTGTKQFYGISWGDRTNTYEFKKKDIIEDRGA